MCVFSRTASASSASRRLAAMLHLCCLWLMANTVGCTVPPKKSPSLQNTGIAGIESASVSSVSVKISNGEEFKHNDKTRVSAAAGSAAFERESRLQADLEQVSFMLKGGNLDGALRLADRLERDNAEDPYITMQTSYLKAMVFHRMNDAKQRKASMDKMLKSMEALQKDKRFRKAYEDGKDCSELIKMSIEKAGSIYETN